MAFLIEWFYKTDCTGDRLEMSEKVYGRLVAKSLEEAYRVYEDMVDWAINSNDHASGEVYLWEYPETNYSLLMNGPRGADHYERRTLVASVTETKSEHYVKLRKTY